MRHDGGQIHGTPVSIRFWHFLLLLTANCCCCSSSQNILALPTELLFEGSCQQLFSISSLNVTSGNWRGGCKCTLAHSYPQAHFHSLQPGNGTEDIGRGKRLPLKCCCIGEAAIPEVLRMAMREQSELEGRHSAQLILEQLFLFNVLHLHSLGSSSFSGFTDLLEVFVDSCPHLESIDSLAFARMKWLRKLHISNCPRLIHWEGKLLRDNPLLQTLIVRNNGLSVLPQMEMRTNGIGNGSGIGSSAANSSPLSPAASLPMERIDFSENCIARIESNSMQNVWAKSMLLNGNKGCLTTIDGNAFPGCKFVILQLGNNPMLSRLHPDAFSGLQHIEHLDLSGTGITRLPHAGLRSLKHLTLRAVHGLKRLPPVLAFPNLVRAEFTYSHHCCFFKYAVRDFYARKEKLRTQLGDSRDRKWRWIEEDGQGSENSNDEQHLEENYRELQQRVCRGKAKGDEAGTAGILVRRRKSRELSLDKARDAKMALFRDLEDWYRNIQLRPSSLFANKENERIDGPKAFTGSELGKTFRLRRCGQAEIGRFFLNISCSPQPDALNPCEDIVSNWLLRVVIWLMWLGAIFGNLAVWVVILTAWQHKMRLHYLFMLNLSFADFLTGVYLAMLAAIDLQTADEYYNFALEWQTGGGCALAGFLSVLASELSLFSMLMIALEIFYNSRFAFYGRRLSPFWAGLALLLGYAYSIGMASLPLLGISSYEHSSICLPLHIATGLDQAYILLVLGLGGVAFAAMIFLYIFLNCTLRHSKAASATRAEEDKQILRRTIVLIGTNMLCWVPCLFFGITAAMGWPLITLSSAKWCLILFYPINACANPLLYVFLTRTWRDAKRNAGPLIRRSLAAAGATRFPHGGIFLSSKRQLFNSNSANSSKSSAAGFLSDQPLHHKITQTEELDETLHGQRMLRTIHCCETRRYRKLGLGELFQEEGKREHGHGGDEEEGEQGRHGHRKGDAWRWSRRRASDGDFHGRKRGKELRPFLSRNVPKSSWDSQNQLARTKVSTAPEMSAISESSMASANPENNSGIKQEGNKEDGDRKLTGGSITEAKREDKRARQTRQNQEQGVGSERHNTSALCSRKSRAMLKLWWDGYLHQSPVPCQ